MRISVDQLKTSQARGRARSQQDVGETSWMVEEGNAALDLAAQVAQEQNTQAGVETIDSRVQDQPAANDPIVFPSLGEEEEADTPSALDIKRLVYGVWERKWTVIAITVAITALFLAIAVFLVSKDWTAKSVLIKRVDTDQFQIGGGVPFKQQAYSFETMLDTLLLPSILGSTLERSGVAARTTTLAGAVSLIRGRQSNLFQIKVTWDDPAVAAALTNNLVASFLDNNRDMRREEAEKVFDYYSLQLSEVESKASNLDRQIQDFQRENSVINFDRQSEITLRKITDLEVQHRSILAELEEIIANDAQLDARIAETPEMTIQTTLYKNPLKYKLSELEWQLEQLRGRYTDENPKVIELLDQVNSLKASIAEGGDQETPENIYAINPVRESLIMKQLENQDTISIKSALATALGESLAQSRSELAELTENNRTYSGLVQERESLSDLLDTLRNRVEEARIIMEANQADFELVEGAAIPRESNPTPKKLIAVAGAVLGAGVGVFIALLLEFLNPRIRTAREVRGLSGVERVFEIEELPGDLTGWSDPDQPDQDLAVVIRRILNNLDSELSAQESKFLAVTSLERGAGRSQLAANLAVASMQKQNSTLLIDADLSKGAGERSGVALGVAEEAQGLGDHLLRGVGIKSLIKATAWHGLRIIGSGSQVGTGRESMMALSGKRMRALLMKLRQTDRRVVIDLPPLGRDESVFELVHSIGRVILVAQAGQTRKDDLKRFADRAERSGIEILGVVLTKVPPILSNENRQFS